MMIFFTGPHSAKSSWICSSVVKNETFPTYKVVEVRKRSKYSSKDPSNRRSLYCVNGSWSKKRRAMMRVERSLF